jgi:hypothetical protein
MICVLCYAFCRVGDESLLGFETIAGRVYCKVHATQQKQQLAMIEKVKAIRRHPTQSDVTKAGEWWELERDFDDYLRRHESTMVQSFEQFQRQRVTLQDTQDAQNEEVDFPSGRADRA